MNRLVPRCSSRASSFHLLRHFYLPPRRFPLSSKPDPCGLLHQSSFLSSPFKTTAWLHSTASRSRASAEAKESSSTISSDDADESKPADYDPSNFDPTECRSLPSQKVLRIVDEIANLTLLEASDLSYLLKKKLGLPDAAMPYFGGGMGQTMAMQPQTAPAAPEEQKPEKTTFDVKLEKFDAASKIKIIKEVRAITSLGLKEAKDVVEKLPAVLKKGVSKEEADQIVEKFKTVGASVILE